LSALRIPHSAFGSARLVPTAATEGRAPPYIVQCILHRLAERSVDALREQPIESGALVHFVEMRDGPARVEHAFAVARTHGRTVRIVQRALDEIARWKQIFQPLLILDADGVAAEVI